MKASPVQLLQLFFQKVDVEFDSLHAPAETPNPLTNIFTFDGVALRTEVTLADVDLHHEFGQMFAVTLQLMALNDGGDDPKVKFSPYKIEVAASALLLISKGSEVLDLPQNLAIVNGASLLWSAIREQVLTITSRMQAGPVMLPTVHFHDLKKATVSTAIVEDNAVPKKRPATNARKPRS